MITSIISTVSITAIFFAVAYWRLYKSYRDGYLNNLNVGDVIQYHRLGHIVTAKIARIDKDNKCIYTPYGEKIEYSQLITQ